MESWRKELIQGWYIGINSQSIQVIKVEWANFIRSCNSEDPIVCGIMNSNDSILGFLLVALFTLKLLRDASSQDQVMIEGSIKFIDR